MRILEYDSKRAPEIRILDLIDIDTVVTDLSIRNIVKPVDQVGNRRLPCSGSSDKGNLLPRFCPEADMEAFDFKKSVYAPLAV